ncbi:MAG: 3'(2'),5'-bisphosphate nucleotidase CysQ [Bacteroidales bacterium]|nr:3'(2'),5'-bisphosphate nucleotidase CysQ [Bacteroidales bacterium]
MNSFTEDSSWIYYAIRSAIFAGDAILNVYNQEFDVHIKEDNSPLTQADLESDKIISKYLKTTPFPFISEETAATPYHERKKWKKFWLVDPLDGTKEFVGKNGEFTVNIALIDSNYPIAGIIYIPVVDELYYSYKGMGVFKSSGRQFLDFTMEDFIADEIKIKSTPLNEGFIRAYGSRSHQNKNTIDFLEKLALKRNEKLDLKSVGSSIKFCYLAEHCAHVYPRFSPTMEWDTAAGQAILEESGGKLTIAYSNERLTYNKEILLNPSFVAFAALVDYLY